MSKLSEISIYNRFSWAVPVIPEVPDGFFAQPKPWDFDQPILELIEQMFLEIEEFFASKNMPVEIAIYEITEVFGYLKIESFTPHREISMLFEKYKHLSKGYFY